ncbi:phosphatidylserine lipase ABHD16A isoform X2 [Battus philenor]|uniref:phosphatidylserine lipase ABHD16A isoform X2 n=1 Tax=Battus philenor TaxID=42288 RepID=UPI0035D0A25D
MFKLTFLSLFSPRLFKKHGDGLHDVLYQSNNLEKWGDLVIKTVKTVTSISKYTSPFIGFYIYRKGLYTTEKIQSITPLFVGIGWLLALSLIVRALGRALNAQYVEFLNVLNNTTADRKTYLESIRKYDFEFSKWPVSYSVPQIKRKWLQTSPFTQCANPNLPTYQKATIQILAYAAVHSFGLRLIYPGTLTLIQTSLWRFLITGRAQLVEHFNGKRSKLISADGNSIDTMFVDNRQLSNKGNILVICCEGNSGFYEIGIMTTPIKAGYSALGWNHPGFAGSTGTPFPSQEQNAIDVVMQYAINELGFEIKNIVLFGWSIGGYTATWAAVTYPEVKALVLDATFDDLLPIAQNQMPSSWALLVKEVVRSYADLNIAQMIRKYNGPVQIIRRTKDEVIALRQGYVQTNRGNNLLIKLIEARYPDVSTEELAILEKYVNLLSTQRAALERCEVGESDRRMLKLISKYMHDFVTTHCTPLPEEKFMRIMDGISTNRD